MKKVKKLNILSILLLPFAVIISYLASCFPDIVERFYAQNIYPLIGQTLSCITGVFPFSIGEIIVICLILFIAFNIISFLYHVAREKQNRRETILGYSKALLLHISLFYFVFIFIWGLNYHRMPFSHIAGLDVKPSSVKELNILCVSLIDRANALRERAFEDQDGIMKLSKNKSDIFSRTHLGFMNVSHSIPALGGNYGRPKGVIFSKAMSYMGISGIFFPFTAEANVNIDIPDAMIPSTACHEMAHQRGFAREDEANYIAYLASTIHPDADFQYSGVLLALLHSMNALYAHDSASYKKLKLLYDEGLQRDLANVTVYWKQYEGPIERVHTKMNDVYLKSNMQEDGVHSYGRMVDLLLAEHRTKLSKTNEYE
ncbi:MAG: hypothetical protein K0R93_1840 [Anaerosolibacter sp.]|jgi:hypothetical protein|uniref:DUF3810 domain-containing protein n=1 Tax=Anaerosolibacter sp. TaxID=1872527 RepID=UPI002623D987|nr:DUF3810 domain-containing protein [Anaerosolibacter sp.]MDF2546942.1 hypothetical protein [Anaerosolibacter sp.]